ncbi:MAG: long-chain fatty acid--CoA ligase [Spirochaetae bacterium HGW-Spirochaetae-8]|nr:MAG: long-chain fatty acid--CoA ligase [Spirochaetae bacterium HGW-Spirochaetae-8]
MYQTIPQLLQHIVMGNQKVDVQLSKDDEGNFHPTTYEQLYKLVLDLAAGLHLLGVARGSHVGLIADNRKEWLNADLAILSLGAADVPRGRDAMPYELAFILGVTESKVTFAENADQARKILELKDKLPVLSTLILMDPRYKDEPIAEGVPEGVSLLTFEEVLASGVAFNKKNKSFVENEISLGKADDLATIIFTSGTTGEPKGVMLSHRNFLFQLEQLPKVIDFKTGERWLSVLPVWHSFERILQYVVLSQASTIAYSKPIGKIMLVDLQRLNPSWMGSVPRIWEAVKAGVYQNVKSKSPVARGLFHFFVWVGATHAAAKNLVTNRVPQFSHRFYPLDFLLGIVPFLVLYPFLLLGNVLVFKNIRKKFGTNFRAGVSGGGSLPSSVDRFFKAIGITLLDGYGLTETAPVIGLRPIKKQVPGTVAPLPETEIKIIDENGKNVPPGKKGVIHARGQQVMLGYYKRPDLTAAILSKDGWLNTGDIGVWTHQGEYAIKGRAKDTIVLSGGENIEPLPIEARLRESEYIEQAVVVGQDKKYLGALIVPDTKALEVYIKQNAIPYMARFDICELPEVNELLNSEINELISSKNGFKSFEHINKFTILKTSFKIGQELSAKQEVMRHKVQQLYKKEIDSLF